MAKCLICAAEWGAGEKVCGSCGFERELPLFLEAGQHQLWLREVVQPAREAWFARQEAERLAREEEERRQRAARRERALENPARFVAAGGGFWAWNQPEGGVGLGGSPSFVLRMKTRDWRDVAMLAAGRRLLLGLRGDGSVAVAGEGLGVDGVANWRDIAQICAGGETCVAVDRAGRTFASGAHSQAILDQTRGGVRPDGGKSIALGEARFAWIDREDRAWLAGVEGGARPLLLADADEAVRLTEGELPWALVRGRFVQEARLDALLGPGGDCLRRLIDYLEEEGNPAVRAAWTGEESCYAVCEDDVLRGVARRGRSSTWADSIAREEGELRLCRVPVGEGRALLGAWEMDAGSSLLVLRDDGARLLPARFSLSKGEWQGEGR